MLKHPLFITFFGIFSQKKSSIFSTDGSNFFKKKSVHLRFFLKKNLYSLAASYALYAKSYVTTAGSSVSQFVIRFRPSDLSSLYFSSFSSAFSTLPLFYFLRKHKLFNKGRYSRNRQTYRTGMYWCLWINILAVTGFYYWFYRFTMNFGYLWPFFSLFVLSFFVPRAIKYNYFYFSNTVSSLLKLLNWFYLIFSDIFFLLKNILASFFNIITLNNKLIFSKQTSTFFCFNSLSLLFSYIFAVFNFSFFKINTSTDLLVKKYSHWNYFLPVSWIHRDHRSNFYKRLYYIFFSNKLN